MRKIDLSTQPQGESAPFRARRNPDPWQLEQLCIANANVSDRDHSIFFEYPLVEVNGRPSIHPFGVRIAVG
jgi:hypothetical protein